MTTYEERTNKGMKNFEEACHLLAHHPSAQCKLYQAYTFEEMADLNPQYLAWMGTEMARAW